jgi:hypothetical protein
MKIIILDKKDYSSRKMAWNFPKWGEDGERIADQKTRGYGFISVTPCFCLVSPVGIEPTTY